MIQCNSTSPCPICLSSVYYITFPRPKAGDWPSKVSAHAAMKIFKVLIIFAFSVIAAQASLTETAIQPISEVEAADIVQAREAAKAARKAEIRANIESATVTKEFVHQKGARQVVLRRVHRPAFSIPTRKADHDSSIAYEEDTEAVAFSPISVENYRWEMISFSAYRYDDLYAEITWRKQGSPESYTLWTNVPLKFLPALNSFEFDGIHYDYFGFVYEISREIEEERAATWSFHGHEYESHWKTPPVELSATEPEYVVVADDPDAVPEKLFEQMDALLGYYLENRSNLQVAHENMMKLNEAQTAYREANPPDPTEESVTIFWPIKNSRYLKDAK